MPTIGTGFLARHLQSLEASHPQALFLAAGVASAICRDPAAFERERQLVNNFILRCRRHGWLPVYFSSVIAGHNPKATANEDDNLSGGYRAHKQAMERLITDSGIDYLIVRLCSLVGRGQNSFQLIPCLWAQIQTGTVTIWRHARRDILDVEDATALLDLLLKRPVKNEVVDVGSGYSVPPETLVDYLSLRGRRTVDKRFVDSGDVHEVDVGRLKALVGSLDKFAFGPNYYRNVIDKYY